MKDDEGETKRTRPAMSAGKDRRRRATSDVCDLKGTATLTASALGPPNFAIRHSSSAIPSDSPLFPAHGGWLLAPEGGAIHPEERVAVIADVHLGYEWARGEGGDCVPAHSLAETLAKLERLLGRAAIERLVVAGDLVESPRPCRRTLADVRRLSRWLGERGVTLIPLAGNHDPRLVPALAATLEVAGWTIAHGHLPIAAPRMISGHLHPVLRGEGVTAPCFLVGPRTIVLPAFSPNAAGWNIATGPPLPSWRVEEVRCIAGAGADLLDFGPVVPLIERLRSP